MILQPRKTRNISAFLSITLDSRANNVSAVSSKLLQMCDIETGKVLLANSVAWPVLLSNIDLVLKICVGLLTVAWLLKKLFSKPPKD